MCSTITPGNDFCGSISSDLARTPDGEGNRFDPEPTTKNSDGGYDLEACPASMPQTWHGLHAASMPLTR